MRLSDWSSDVCSSDLREIGLAGARGAEREDHVVARKRLHIGNLRGRPRNDGFLARADHHRRRLARTLSNDAVERRLRGHRYHRLDEAGVALHAALDPTVEIGTPVAGARRGLRLSLELHAVAARRASYAEAVLDRDEVAVE